MDAKYGFIHGALQEAGYEPGKAKDTYQVTHLIDSILTNKYVGFPIFILLLFIMFSATFVLGEIPKGWIEDGVAWLGEFISNTMPDGPVKDMLVDGVIGGVGAVIVFLPQILILYFFISYMEDSGYMARAAFIMDKLMHKMGLHGKSFIPLIMGFGCNVPAVMATRTIESHRSRLITMLILPLMSCSGSSANLHHGHRNILCHPIPFAHHGIALSHRHLPCRDIEPHLCQFRGEGRRYPIRNGVASLPLPYLEGDRPPYLGKG